MVRGLSATFSLLKQICRVDVYYIVVHMMHTMCIFLWKADKRLFSTKSKIEKKVKGKEIKRKLTWVDVVFAVVPLPLDNTDYNPHAI